LQGLADSDLIWLKESKDYRKLLKEAIEAKGWKDNTDDPDQTSDLVHEELWWDVCAIVNELAQMVLDEREKKQKFLDEVRRELQDAIDNLSPEKFEEYY
jgi:hypothetical protein